MTVTLSFDLVLFGGTGDLAWRKLMPALFQAFRHGTLPAGGRIIGVWATTSTTINTARLSSRALTRWTGQAPQRRGIFRFAALLEYVRMDLSRPEDYAHLASSLQARNAETVVMYLATAPGLFTTICEQLAASELNTPRTRIVLENPGA